MESPEDKETGKSKSKAQREALVTMVITQFHRFVNTSGDKSDNKPLLLLIAALSALNSDISDQKAVASARRLIQLAMTRGRSRR